MVYKKKRTDGFNLKFFYENRITNELRILTEFFYVDTQYVKNSLNNLQEKSRDTTTQSRENSRKESRIGV